MKFMPSVRCFLAAVLLLGVTQARAAEPVCEPAKLAAKYPALAGMTVKIGQDGESPPFSYRDPKDFNKIIGLDADIARAVFACAGVPVTFITGAWSGLIPAAMSGQVDVMWDTLLYTPERAKKLDFVAYMGAITGIMTPKGNPKGLATMDDLCGLQVAAGLGTTQEAQLREATTKCTAAGKKPITIITAPDIPGGIRLVANGRADAFSTNKALITSMIAKLPVELAFEVQTGARIAAGVGKGRKDLRQAIFDSLQALTANGGMKKIFDDHQIDFKLAQAPEVLTE